MNKLTTNQQTAVSAVLDTPAEMREAWKLLQAEHSNSKEITPQRWRILSAAFANVPDDILTRAVLAHMVESPFFPRLSDINKQIQQLRERTPFEVFCERMGRMKPPYKLVSDENGMAVFSNGIQEANVRH